MTIYDFAIIGAGIAGASLAAELADHARVVVLEGEDRPGYHATGRSAAFWEECYGGPEIVPLTLASGSFLRDNGFLSQRGALYIGSDADIVALNDFERRFSGSGATFERLGGAELREHVPGIHDDWTGAIWEPACADIDVAALHAHYLKLGKRRGAQINVRARLRAAVNSEGVWHLETERGDRFRTNILVNAAGAWADNVAHIAGATPIGIQPLRRTVAQIRTDPAPPHDLPLVLDINGGFYFKSESGRLWLSPHDESPSEPCDAAPEELDIALAIDRFTSVCNWRIEAVERRWAGLRSFAPDRLPVYGMDPQCPGFAWFAGQGGFGIQTSPAAARLASQLLLGLDRDAMTETIDAQRYSPQRFV